MRPEGKPYQVQIIGKDSLPQARKGRFAFLAEYERKLKSGQTIRLIIKPKDRSVAVTAWMRITNHKGHTQTIRQQDGSIALYLWKE